MATELLRGEVGPEAFAGASLTDPATHALAARIRVEQDANPDLNALWPQRFAIRLKDGWTWDRAGRQGDRPSRQSALARGAARQVPALLGTRATAARRRGRGDRRGRGARLARRRPRSHRAGTGPQLIERFADRFTRAVERIVAYALVLAVLVDFANVVARYVFQRADPRRGRAPDLPDGLDDVSRRGGRDLAPDAPADGSRRRTAARSGARLAPSRRGRRRGGALGARARRVVPLHRADVRDRPAERRARAAELDRALGGGDRVRAHGPDRVYGVVRRAAKAPGT